MRRFLFCILLVFMSTFPALANVPEYVEGEVLILTDAPAESDYTVMGSFNRNVYSQAISDQAETFARTRGLETHGSFPEIARLTGKNIIYLRSDHKSTEELIKELSSDPEVISVQPNYIRTVDVFPNDYFNYNLWGMGNIRMPQVWDYAIGSNSVCVAVLDTGIDYNHMDLNANMAIDSYGNYGRRFYSEGLESSNAMDIDNHGTHVAGTIGAIGNNGIGVVGVNWNVKILNVNVFTEGVGPGEPEAKEIDVIKMNSQ